MNVSNALQSMIFTRLTTDASVTALVGQKVYDQPPATVAVPYISFGPSDVTFDDPDCLTTRHEALQIDCWSTATDGKREIKAIVDAVKTSLHKYPGTIDPGALVSIEVTLVRILDDPDGITKHGVITVEAEIEEA